MENKDKSREEILIAKYKKRIEIQEQQLTEMKDLIDKSIDSYLKYSALLELEKTKLINYQENFNAMTKK